jgi:hypothetical protein
MTLSERNLAIRLLLHFSLVFVLFASFFLRLPILWDADSYYHLAVARLYGTDGPAAPIPWARFSMLGSGSPPRHSSLVPCDCAQSFWRC